MDEQKLKNYLMKCELQYRADHQEKGDCLNWLAPHCGNTEEIWHFLKGIGFRIKSVVDEEPWPGELHQWVITTSGIIVYVNQDNLQGFFAKEASGNRDIRKKGV